jgi:hypothetical protein
MRERKSAYRVMEEKTVNEHLEEIGVDGRIILKYIFKKRNRGMD